MSVGRRVPRLFAHGGMRGPLRPAVAWLLTVACVLGQTFIDLVYFDKAGSDDPMCWTAIQAAVNASNNVTGVSILGSRTLRVEKIGDSIHCRASPTAVP